LNPERGFYNDKNLTASSDYSSVRANGSTLVHTYIRLDNYKSTDLPSSLLTDIDGGFAKLRSAKIKTILRFTYNFDETSPDASAAWITKHLAQIKPILEKNKDGIYMVQAGFVGAWGEWHSSTNFNAGIDGNGADFTTLKPVFDGILSSIPSNRFTALRYAAFHKGLISPSEITSSNAFNGSPLSRTGFHNDCFASDKTDGGTYNVTGQTPQQVKDYMANQTRYVPMTGESCSYSSTYSTCSVALADLKYMHWTALSNDWEHRYHQ
jgi:hypothetical protein